MRSKLVPKFALILALLFAACSTANNTFDICSAVSVVQTQQTVIEAAAVTLISLKATIPASEMAKAAAAYGAWYSTQGLIQSSLIAVNDSGGSGITIQQYAQLLAQAVLLAGEFIAIYNSLEKTPTIASGKVQMAAAAAPGCTMTDAQITTALTANLQTWAQLGGP